MYCTIGMLNNIYFRSSEFSEAIGHSLKYRLIQRIVKLKDISDVQINIYDTVYNDLDDSIVKKITHHMRRTINSITKEFIGNDTSSKSNKIKLAPYSANYTSDVYSNPPIGEKNMATGTSTTPSLRTITTPIVISLTGVVPIVLYCNIHYIVSCCVVLTTFLCVIITFCVFLCFFVLSQYCLYVTTLFCVLLYFFVMLQCHVICYNIVTVQKNIKRHKT